MPFRIEVLAGGKIELMHARTGQDPYFLYFTDLERFHKIFAYLLRREIAAERRERFIPELTRVCQRQLKKTLKGENHGKRQ